MKAPTIDEAMTALTCACTAKQRLAAAEMLAQAAKLEADRLREVLAKASQVPA